MAGESAREIAEKRRQKAARLTRVADAYDKGADGEQVTAAALRALPLTTWSVIHDVRWPGREFANIDHVVVGPPGIFVIDSKAWSGRVEIRAGVLRQNGWKRQSALEGASEAAVAVARATGIDPRLVHPVLCFVGPSGVAGRAGNVALTTPSNLVAMLLSRPPVWGATSMRQALLGLQKALTSARSAPRSVPRGVPRRPVTPPSPATASGYVRRASRGLLGLVVLVTVGVFGFVVLRESFHNLARGIARHGTEATVDRHLGRRVRLPSAEGRPPLTITATAAGTVHRLGSMPYLVDGNRFFGVRLTVHNAGRRAWVSEPGTTYQVTDALGVPHAGGAGIRLREGRVLHDPIRVPAGGTVRGYVVFQLRADQPVTGVSVTVGPGSPSTAVWRIERQ